MEQLIVHLPENAQPGEYIIRRGEAGKPHNIEPISLKGNFKAPAEYVSKRKRVTTETHKDQCSVLFDKPQLSITFTELEQSAGKITVEGKLTRHPFLTSLGLNKSAHSKDSLLQLIRFKGHLFQDRLAHSQLVNQLMRWNIKATINQFDENEKNGNRNTGVSIQAEIPATKDPFEVLVPFFEGDEPYKLQVKIEAEITNSQVLLYVVCENFEELWETAVDSKFDSMRETFAPFAIIER
nr:hypothetical protein [uncultured Arsenicibacter sp.]